MNLNINQKKKEIKFLSKYKIHEGSIFSITKTSYGVLVTTSRDGSIKFFG